MAGDGVRREPLHEAHGTPERAALAYGRGVRTALGNNATAYAFSISITSSYGLLSGTRGSVEPMETIAFGVAGAIAFLSVGAAFVAITPGGSLPEGRRTAMISGGVDVLSVLVAVAAAIGLSQIPGFMAWPLTAFGTVSVFLLVGGFDVIVARIIARHTSIGRSQ